jgi:hypothetical protein
LWDAGHFQGPGSELGLDGSKEAVMSITKTILAIGLFTIVAACAQQEEVMVETPVMEEPTMSKY